MILTTTGTSPTVTISGLLDINNNDLVLTHPQTINLLDFYDDEDIAGVSASIQVAIAAGTITATTQGLVPITDATAVTTTISDLDDVAFSGDYADLAGLPTLGTAAAADSTDFATSAQGALADSAIQSGDNVSELVNDSGFIDAAGAPVQSVNGNIGTVVLDSDAVSEGGSNLYFTNTRVAAAPATVANTAKVSADGSVGTHSDVDLTGILSGDILSWDGSSFGPVSTSNGYTIFPIWAEEGGALSNNNRQWSFGNGAVGNINIVIPIDCEMFAVSFDAETGSGTVSIDIMRDDVSAFTTKAFAALKDFETLASPLALTAGQCLGFRTNTETAAHNDARVCAWLRVRSSPAATSILNDLLDVSAGAPSVGNVLGWNGSNWAPTSVGSGAQVIVNDFTTFSTTISGGTFVNLGSVSITLASAGWVYGIATMTAVRSTGTNAVSQFRVQINGNNGTTMLDTLSTFNDTVVAQHRVLLAAGTYTVIAQGIGDTGATVSGNLYAVGIES